VEIWENIDKYEGLYQVSNIGKVKSLKRRGIKEKILKQMLISNGYLVVNLHNKDMKTRYVHSLVGKAFLSNYETKLQINHKNGIKTDNRVENLEFVTAKENIKHAYDTGLRTPTYKKVLMSTLDNKPLLWFDSQAEASKMSGVPQPNISLCCSGKYKTAGGYKWEFYYENN
jgi:hypothetical protein